MYIQLEMLSHNWANDPWITFYPKFSIILLYFFPPALPAFFQRFVNKCDRGAEWACPQRTTRSGSPGCMPTAWTYSPSPVYPTPDTKDCIVLFSSYIEPRDLSRHDVTT